MSTRFTIAFALAFGLLTVAGAFAPRAAAQTAPDIRNIRPVVMLLTDTSGSMEFTPGCTCTSASCSECEPDCGASEENRWAIVLQALTGTWTPSYTCSRQNRVGGKYLGQYDNGYFFPHFDLPHETGSPAQDTNGILDDYFERIKFGLMTFDGEGTLLTDGPLVLQTDYEVAGYLASAAAALGMWSYGDRKPFTYPAGTPDVYMIDIGARSATATEGPLISAAEPYVANNALVQSTLLSTTLRPYGPTPTAGMMDDLQYYLQNNSDVFEKVLSGGPGDEYYNCRTRSAILITDGIPNADMRGSPVNCETLGQPVGPTGCPYEETEDIVGNLPGSASLIESGELDKLYVIGFNLDDAMEEASVKAVLDDIAAMGDTEEAILVSTRAELYSTIAAILDELNPGATSRTAPVLTGASPGLPEAQFLSGFNPSFSAADPWDGVLERRRYLCVDGVPELQEIEDEDRFHEVLNAQSSAPSGVEPFSSEKGLDDATFAFTSTFDGSLSRNLWTVLPDDPADIDEPLASNGEDKLLNVTPTAMPIPPAGTPTYIRDVEPSAFRATIPETYFSVGTTGERDDIVNFVHGETGTAREDQRLGAIYHSTPVVVGPITSNLDDESFNRFRNEVDVGNLVQLSPDPDDDLTLDGWNLTGRPRVVYAATNDGIIHAFLTDDGPAAGAALPEFDCIEELDAGTELWGFIPPILLDNLKDLDTGGLDLLADGDLIVKNLLDVRTLSSSIAPTANAWRTVLFMNLRSEAAAVALDITNPCKPEFLWQFAGDPDLAVTFGRPAAAQVFLEASGSYAKQERAVIIIPGGGDESTETGGSCAVVGDALPNDISWSDMTAVTPRPSRRCWCATGDASCPTTPSGRALFFLDMITGEVIKKFGEATFPAPVNGGVSVFRGDTGQIGSVVYVGDADGVLWRVNITDPDPTNWEAIAFHDIFHDGAFDTASGSRNYNPPVLSIDINGNVVVLHGTGNIDILDDATAVNKVVSLIERLEFDPADNGLITSIEGTLSWEITLNAGEQVTGPLELFNGTLFFGTFQASGASAVNSCPFDGSRIFGVSFLEDPANARDPEPRLTDIMGNATTNLDSVDIPELGTTLLMGLQVAQVPTCITPSVAPSIIDPFTGATRTNFPIPQQTSGREFRLVGHLSGSKTGVAGSTIDVLDEAMPQLISETLMSEFVESAE